MTHRKKNARTRAMAACAAAVVCLAACGAPKEPPADEGYATPPQSAEGLPMLPQESVQVPAGSSPNGSVPRFDTEANQPNLGQSQSQQSGQNAPAPEIAKKEEPRVIDGPDGKKYLNNEICVKFVGTMTAGQATAFADGYTATVDGAPREDGSYKLVLDDPLPYDDLLILATRMRTSTSVTDAWLEPVPEVTDGGIPSSSTASQPSSEEPPKIVSSEGNVLVYDRAPDTPDVDPYGGRG